MKDGARAVGIAASDGAASGDPSTLCGAVVRADRVADGFAFATATVGGEDATTAGETILTSLGREDAHAVLLAGVAPAWFNLFDLERIHVVSDVPVVAVSFEESEGLEPALREAFEGEALARRLAVYERLAPRRETTVNGERLFLRAVGCDDEQAAAIVEAFTPEGGRPEPLRVARLAARGAREWAERSSR